MRISELAQACAIPKETIRYYEKLGLMPEPQRQSNGYRRYNRQHLQRLMFIRHCRALDIPLSDIQRLLNFLAQPEADCAEIDRLIEVRLVEVRQRLEALSHLEQQLTALRSCCAEGQQVRACGILQELLDHTQTAPSNTVRR